METTVTYRKSRLFEIILIAVSLIAFAIAGLVMSHNSLGFSGGPNNNPNLGFSIPKNLSSTTLTKYITKTDTRNQTFTVTRYNDTTYTSTATKTLTEVTVNTTTVTATITSNSTIFVFGSTTTTTTITVTSTSSNSTSSTPT